MNSREREEKYTLSTYNHLRFPISIVRGEGSRVFDDKGRSYLDLYGGHAVCLIGHCHPRWVEDMRRQLGKLVFYSNTVYCDLRGEAAQLLVKRSYSTMSGVFFCGSGAEANETALKIARKATGRPLVIAMENGFHGRTIGALSATGYPSMRNAFPENTDRWTRFVPLGDLAAIEAVPPSEVAAVILEPIQSVSGVFMAPPPYYPSLRRYCTEHDIALIFDEVQTGSGRTGLWYAGHHWGVAPDIATTAKGVGGGFPVGVVIAGGRFAASVKPGDQATTFGGGPLAAAAIVSTYKIIDEENLIERSAGESTLMRYKLETFSGVTEIRGLGYLLGVATRIPAKELQKKLMDDYGILVGTSGDPQTIRLLPPLTVTEDEWREFTSAMSELLR